MTLSGPQLSEVTPHFLAKHPEYVHMLSVTSEILEWQNTSLSNKPKNQTKEKLTANTNILAKIMNFTKLHNYLKLVLGQIYFPVTLKERRPHSNEVEILRTKAWDAEHDKLIRFISECNQNALIVPEDLRLANNIGKGLQRNGTSNVYVGKEQYSNISISVFISGWVKPAVLVRMEHIKQAGIWDWMPKFFRSTQKYLSKEGNLEVEKPTMSGNIVLLFFILLYGAIAAIVLFLIEIRIALYDGVLYTISKISRLFCWIFNRVVVLLSRLKICKLINSG